MVTAPHLIAVTTGNLLGNFSLSSLGDRRNWAGLGVLFADLHRTGAITGTTLERAARTIARTVRGGDLINANKARVSMVGDLTGSKPSQSVRFSTETNLLLATLRERLVGSKSYGTEGLERGLNKIEKMGPQWGPFFNSAQELIDRIVDGAYFRPTTRLMFETLQRIVDGHQEGLPVEVLGGLLALFGQKLTETPRGKSNKIPGSVDKALEREKKRMARLAQPSGEVTEKSVVETLSRMVERSVTLDEILIQIRRITKKNRDLGGGEPKIVGMETIGRELFILYDAKEPRLLGGSSRLTSSVRVEISLGKKWDPVTQTMVPWNFFQLVPEALSSHGEVDRAGRTVHRRAFLMDEQQ